jgi:hypothetical protein
MLSVHVSCGWLSHFGEVEKVKDINIIQLAQGGSLDRGLFDTGLSRRRGETH